MFEYAKRVLRLEIKSIKDLFVYDKDEPFFINKIRELESAIKILRKEGEKLEPLDVKGSRCSEPGLI